MDKLSQEQKEKFEAQAEKLLSHPGVGPNLPTIRESLKRQIVNAMMAAFFDGRSMQIGLDFAAANKSVSRNLARRGGVR